MSSRSGSTVGGCGWPNTHSWRCSTPTGLHRYTWWNTKLLSRFGNVVSVACHARRERTLVPMVWIGGEVERQNEQLGALNPARFHSDRPQSTSKLLQLSAAPGVRTPGAAACQWVSDEHAG